MNKVQPLITSNARECLPFGIRYRLKAKRNPGLSYSVNPINKITEEKEERVYRAHPQSGLSDTSIRLVESNAPSEEGGLGFLTKETSDANVVSIIKNPKSLDFGAISGGSDGSDRYKGIKEFLAIPRILTKGSLASTDNAGTFPQYTTSRNLFFTSLANWDKIKGFHSIRYDTVVTIEFNANRFQTGYYMLCHIPIGGAQRGGLYSNLWRYDKTTITQLPHVSFDLNCDTQAQLTIPYVAGTNAHKIDSTGAMEGGDPGYIFLYPYVPLGATAGSTTASYTIWVHYTNVELFGAAIPQSGFRKGKKGKDLLATEMKQQGPIEATMTLITDSATALSMVPLLSSVATPVAWIADALRKTALSFGWSKPLLIDPPQRVVREIVPYIANCDTKSVAEPLSLMSTNHVEVAPGFGGTDLDELSIDYLKSIPAYYSTINWNDTQVAGTELVTGYSLPSVYVNDTVDGGLTLRSFTPIGFLGSYFAQWRGGIRYHFKIVKTEFHSGRLLFAWTGLTNQYSEVNPTMTMLEAEYTHKQIIDVREGSEFTIQVPFASITNWNSTESEERNISGRWSLYVLDVLKQPATVASSINIILEVSGAPDLQFSVPKQFNYFPCIPSTLQSGFGKECNLMDSMVGNSSEQQMDLRYCSLSTGEVVSSLRQILKRGGFVTDAFVAASTADFVAPFATTLLESTGLPAPLGLALFDPYALISTFYALSRGGMRIASIPTAGNASDMVFTGLKRLKTADTITSFRSGVALSVGQFVYDSGNTGINLALDSLGGNQIQIPQYTQGHSRATCANIYTTIAITTVDPLVDRSTIQVRRSTTATATPPIYYRSVADDFNLGCFIAIPPMFLVVRP